MKNRIAWIAGMVLLMLTLCACSKDTAEADYNGYTAQDLQDVCLQTAETLEGLSQQQAIQYYTYYAAQDGGELYAALMDQWINVRPQVGGLVGYKDFEVNQAGKTITAIQTISHEERDITLTYVFNAHTMEVTDIQVQPVYTLGETMHKAGLNTLMGISVVFVILVLISLVIYCFNIIPMLQKRYAAQADLITEDKAEENEEEEVANHRDDGELIAVIAAAVAMETGMDTDDFVVRSIKRRY